MKISLYRNYTVWSVLAQIALFCTLLLITTASVSAADEYTGKLDPQLAANKDDLEQVIFRPIGNLSKIKIAKPPDSDAFVIKL
jgi:hypothetical protein